MSSFFDRAKTGAGGTNALTRASSGSLADLAAAKRAVGATTPQSPPATANASSAATLGALAAAKRKTEEHRQRPFLVYIILDLTISREDTRAAMRSYENQITKLVMESGGKHPVLCKGVYYRGDYCSEPQTLENQEAVQKFFDMNPECGGTRIHRALTHYKNNSTDAVLSLGILIGDTADSDNANSLVELAKSMKGDKSSRPIVIAYEQTSDSHSPQFCCKETGTASRVSSASGGFAFGLSEHPTELIKLLEGYKAILSATPEELKATVSAAATNSGAGIFAQLSPKGREFLADQANRLIVPLLGKPTGT